jgi:hypothetical protein
MFRLSLASIFRALADPLLTKLPTNDWAQLRQCYWQVPSKPDAPIEHVYFPIEEWCRSSSRACPTEPRSRSGSERVIGVAILLGAATSRLARWLLTARDRAELPLNQFLSMMLGTRRVGVT